MKIFKRLLIAVANVASKIFSIFLPRSKKETAETQRTKIKKISDRHRIKVTKSTKIIKKSTRKISMFSESLIKALEYVRPQICVQKSCCNHKNKWNQRYPVYISRITYVCPKCGHYYPIVNNKAVRMIKYMKTSRVA